MTDRVADEMMNLNIDRVHLLRCGVNNPSLTKRLGTGGTDMETLLVLAAIVWGVPIVVAALGAAPMAFSERYRRFMMVQLISG